MLPGSCPTAGRAIRETSHTYNAAIVVQDKNGVKLQPKPGYNTQSQPKRANHIGSVRLPWAQGVCGVCSIPITLGLKPAETCHLVFHAVSGCFRFPSPTPECCKTALLPATIAGVENVNQSNALAPSGGNPFRPGIMVLVTLGNPREKFWGAILSLTPEGLSLCGVELASFDDLVSLVKDGEPFSPGVVFLPMHRLERMELDLPDGNLPSLSQRFVSKTGLDPAAILIRHSAANPIEGQK
jgi:hypothetical protein